MWFWQRNRQEEALAFVDYEHWYFSLLEKFRVKPDVGAWAKEVREQYNVTEMRFFGNFLQGALQEEVTRVRAVTNDIIETQFGNPGFRMKDMLDFILLDHLYRAAGDKYFPKTFLLFTGDGHFAPAVRYLVQEKKKQVIVYGIGGCVSHFLKEAASQWKEIPDEQEQLRLCRQYIVSYYDYIAGKYQEVILTFRKVVDAVSRERNIPTQTVEIALSQMIEEGLLTKSAAILPKEIPSTSWSRSGTGL